MHRSVLVSFFAAIGAAGALLACVGDDTVGPAPVDAGTPDATAHTDAAFPFDAALPPEGGAAPDASPDAGDAGDGGDAGAFDAGGPFLLLSYAPDYSHTQYSTYDLRAGAQVGDLTYGNFGTNQATARAPWVLNQGGDVVTRMDAVRPWQPAGSWSVAEPKSADAGAGYSDPWSIAETATEAYVSLYNRNVVAVLDTTASPADAGVPSKTIDLGALLQAGDADGYVEATSLVYDATRKRVWAVLANIDLFNVDPSGFYQLCTPGLTSTVVAIDTTTDTLVNGVSYTLQGVSPTSVVYDAAGDRLLVESAGCNEPNDAGADAGLGPLSGRVIESIALATGHSTLLYDADAQGFPGAFTYVDATHAFVAFGFGGPPFAWDPTSTTLGAQLSVAPDTYAWDGKGHLVGPMTSYLGDGGLAGITVVAVDPNDGGVTTLGSNPVTNPNASGYWEGVALWPQP